MSTQFSQSARSALLKRKGINYYYYYYAEFTKKKKKSQELEVEMRRRHSSTTVVPTAFLNHLLCFQAPIFTDYYSRYPVFLPGLIYCCDAGIRPWRCSEINSINDRDPWTQSIQTRQHRHVLEASFFFFSRLEKSTFHLLNIVLNLTFCLCFRSFFLLLFFPPGVSFKQ